MTVTDEAPAIDRDAVQPGDTVAWNKHTTRERCWGLVSYTTAEAVHVIIRSPYRDNQYAIKWPRVTAHWPGRGEYDRHQ